MSYPEYIDLGFIDKYIIIKCLLYIVTEVDVIWILIEHFLSKF